MIKNKKGIMLKFLAALILALILFVPACGLVSKFFRLSNQAKSNFHGFVEEIERFSTSPDEAKGKFLLIMDKGSFIVLFNDEAIKKQVAVRIESGVSYGEKDFHYPSSSCGGKPCLCLCRAYDKNEDGVVCNQLICEPLEGMEFTDYWFSVREKDSPMRRSEISLEVQDGKIKVSGGVQLEEDEKEPIEYDEPPVPT